MNSGLVSVFEQYCNIATYILLLQDFSYLKFCFYIVQLIYVSLFYMYYYENKCTTMVWDIIHRKKKMSRELNKFIMRAGNYLLL